MERIRLNRALNKEVKYYGLSLLGMIGAGVIGCSVWLKFNMTIGILGFLIGYGFSAYVAKGWHAGSLQRFIYRYLPCKGLFGGQYLPPAYDRCLL